MRVLCEKHRVVKGQFSTMRDSGPQGAFLVPGPLGDDLWIMASDGRDWPEAMAHAGLPPDAPAWEHVSVHAGTKRPRCPTWREMEFVRDLFWDDDAVVLQFSVPRAQHINHHEHTLHLWRMVGVDATLPPAACV